MRNTRVKSIVLAVIMVIQIIVFNSVGVIADDGSYTVSVSGSDITVSLNVAGLGDIETIIVSGREIYWDSSTNSVSSDTKDNLRNNIDVSKSGNTMTLKFKGLTGSNLYYPPIKNSVTYGATLVSTAGKGKVRLTFDVVSPSIEVAGSEGGKRYYPSTASKSLAVITPRTADGVNIEPSEWSASRNGDIVRLSRNVTAEAYAYSCSYPFQARYVVGDTVLSGRLSNYFDSTVVNKTQGKKYELNMKEGDFNFVEPLQTDTIEKSWGTAPTISGLGIATSTLTMKSSNNVTYNINGTNCYTTKYEVYPVGSANTDSTRVLEAYMVKSGIYTGRIIIHPLSEKEGSLSQIKFRYGYSKVSIGSASVASIGGEIDVNIQLSNTAPKIVTANGVSGGLASAGQINNIDKDLIIGATFADREQSISELSIASIECDDDDILVDFDSRNVTLDLRDMKYGTPSDIYRLEDGSSVDVLYVLVRVKVTDGEFISPEGTIMIPVTESYIVPRINNSTRIPTGTRDIFKREETVIMGELVGTINDSAPNYEQYTMWVDSIRINGGAAVTPRVAQAELELTLDSSASSATANAGKAKGVRVTFKLNSADNVGAGDYFEIRIKTKSLSKETESYMRVNLTADGMESSKEALLYVHRKPISQFKVSVTRNTEKKITALGVQNSKYSYDPDFQYGTDYDKNVDNGVYRVRWDLDILGTREHATIEHTRDEYGTGTNRDGDIDKLVSLNASLPAEEQITDGNSVQMMATAESEVGTQLANWIATGKLDNGASGQRGVSLTLKVQDRCNTGWRNGAWSEPYTITIMGKDNLPPVALFTINQPSFIMPVNNNDFGISLADSSYDLDSDVLSKWDWILYDYTGAILGKVTKKGNSAADLAGVVGNFKTKAIAKAIELQTNNTGETKFSIGLVVYDGDGASSSEYKQEFTIFKENDVPNFNVTDEMVYLEDKAEDGIKGDDKGGATTGGVIQSTLSGITDIFHTSPLKAVWTFEGQEVDDTSKWSRAAEMMHTETVERDIPDGTTSTAKPFDNMTASQKGFKAGVYKVTTTISDKAVGPLMVNGDASTETTKESWLRVIPYISMWVTYEYGGYVDSNWRKSDGATVTSLGLSRDDLVPPAGGEVDVVIYTNKFVDEVVVEPDFNKDGTPDGAAVTLTKDEGTVNTSTLPWVTPVGGDMDVLVWRGTVVLTEEGIENVTTGLDEVNVIGTARSKWEKEGTDTGTKREKKRSKTVEMEAVKLYDFNITKVTDRKLSDKFKAYLGTNTGVYVKDLAVDKNTFSASGTSVYHSMRLGYAFEFNLMSKGLKDANTQVIVYPHFYAISLTGTPELKAWVPSNSGDTYEVFNMYYESGNTMAGFNSGINDKYPVMYGKAGTMDEYYNGGSNYVKIGSLGKLDNLVKTSYSSEQKWEGRYGLPASTKFTLATDTELNASTMKSPDVLITFDIRAIKNNKEKYNYIGKGQWLKERTGYPSNKQTYVDLEATWKAAGKTMGSVIVYSSNKNALEEDYSANPVWKQ